MAGWSRSYSVHHRPAPCARAVEARDGKGLPGQAALRSPTVAGPMTASGHQYLHDDAGVGMIWMVCPVPARASGCGLQPVAKPSWRRSWGGPMGPAGESGRRQTPPGHDKGARGPNGCASPLQAVPATGETACGQALHSGRDYVVTGVLREETNA